ncbi:MAG: hypothetical protein V4681_02635 [Patescibacteria group bacterium]
MARDLGEEKIGKGEFYAYVTVFVAANLFFVAFLVGLEPLIYVPAWLELADKGLAILFILATLALGYQENKRGDGKRFWYRFISLGFPIAIITTVPLIIAISIFVIMGLIDINAFGYIDLLLAIPFYILGLYLTVKYMRVAAGGTA